MLLFAVVVLELVRRFRAGPKVIVVEALIFKQCQELLVDRQSQDAFDCAMLLHVGLLGRNLAQLGSNVDEERRQLLGVADFVGLGLRNLLGVLVLVETRKKHLAKALVLHKQ